MRRSELELVTFPSALNPSRPLPASLPLTDMQTSTSILPSYTPPSKDVISVVPSLSALHPDPLHPAHSSLLANLDLKKDSVKIFSFAQGGIVVLPEEVGISHHRSEDEEEVSLVAQKKGNDTSELTPSSFPSFFFRAGRGYRDTFRSSA